MNKSDILFQRLDCNTGSQYNQDIMLIKLEFLTVWVLKDIAVESEEKTFLIDIWYGTCLNK